MNSVLYGIPNCGTVRKARAWLEEHGIAYRFHDFKKDGVPAGRLSAWQARLGWEAILNRRGTTWRGLSEARRTEVVDAVAAAKLMAEFPSLIKRPILESDGEVLAGFSEADYRRLNR